MEVRRCLKCMRPYDPGEDVCPVCGCRHKQIHTPTHVLIPGTILNGTYLVGTVIGQGGFGITYVGFDLVLEKKVAIKEYYPMSTSLASRNSSISSVVQWSAVASGELRQTALDSFLKEARKMAKLDDIPNAVGVKAMFVQNETAYIVMDFIEGETLKSRFQRTGPMPFGGCISLLKPVITAMEQVHLHNQRLVLGKL